MIAILTPSRNRPERLREMLDAIEYTADRPDQIRVYIGIDHDDPDNQLYAAVHRDWRIHGNETSLKLVRRPRMGLAAWTNLLANLALSDRYDILGSLGDDHRPRTKGWDTRIAEALDNIGYSGLAYGDDGLQGERLPTAPFWTANIIKALGFYFPPAQKHLYADDFWLAFANGLGRRAYLPDVLIEHMHPSAGKAQADAVNETNDAHHDADREAFQRYMRDTYQADLDRVREIL